MGSAAIGPKLKTLQPRGNITAANVEEFQASLTHAVTSPDYSAFLVDMEQVEFLDSAGLMALLSIFRLAQSRGKRFSICSIAPSVRIIFELTQLDRILEIFDNQEDFEGAFNPTLAA
jgi:anti-anti-sigma factor